MNKGGIALQLWGALLRPHWRPAVLQLRRRQVATLNRQMIEAHVLIANTLFELLNRQCPALSIEVGQPKNGCRTSIANEFRPRAAVSFKKSALPLYHAFFLLV